MKSHTSILLVLFALLAAVPTATASSMLSSRTPGPTATATPIPQVVTGVPGLRLRAGPGVRFTILQSLPVGARLSVVGRSADGAWLRVGYRGLTGWVAARYVRALAGLPTVLPPAPAPPSLPATPAMPAVPPSATPTPPAVAERADQVVLGAGVVWPVRANRIVGEGYEFVDASRQWDLVLHRDVYGAVARSFWGPALYEPHPLGIRITLIDPVWDERCPSPVAPIALVADTRCLLEGFGDGTGASLYVGCALPSQHYANPQECFIAITAAGEHLNDIVVAATITGHNMLVAGYSGRTPDFGAAPFTPLLGEAYREGDQWRWRHPFLEIVPGS